MTSIPIYAWLAIAAGVMMIIERRGVPVVLNLNFKGDIKRESRWFAQYGQGACTLVVAVIIWQLDHQRPGHLLHPAIAVLASAFGASVFSTLIKRLLGRVRPGRPAAGSFLGPTWRHANYRESFPSSHSAAAFALSVVLAHLYPQAAAVFWSLAGICAALRYLMDAHWPSDVLGGVALGWAAGVITISMGA